jgi:ATP-dependent helicase/DNAse subunit B
VAGLALGEAVTPAVLNEMVADAEQKAVETFQLIAEGRREVRPADRNKCRYCEFSDICRVESAASEAAAE